MRGIAALIVVVACCFIGVPAAHADDIPVRPGDTIVQGKKKCTLGYVYRWAGYTMGLTAGHCAVKPDTPIIDRDAGVRGTYVNSSFVSESEDWQLIDFGNVPWSQRIRNTSYWMTGRANPRPGQSICHYGVGSDAVSCGTTLAVSSTSLAVATRGIPGDSGGPCFALNGQNEATAIGLWHGHDPDTPSVGYCVTVEAALKAFGENTGGDA